MNDLEQIDLAKAYVALSNAHRHEFIVPIRVRNDRHGGSDREEY